MPKTKRKINNSYFYRTIRKEVNSILHQHLNNDNDNTDASGSNTNNVECLKHINIDDTSNTYINDDQDTSSDSISTCILDDESNIPQLHNVTIDNNLNPVQITNKNISDDLKNWAVKHNIKHEALKDLLQILSRIESKEFLNCPKDPRSFLQTPRSTMLIPVNPGYYCHIGIQKAIEQQYKSLNEKPLAIIEVAINIDGLPLSKSSSSELYPILCINKSLEHKNNIVLIGAYHGSEKPRNFNDFLSDFVKEVIDLTNNGIKILEHIYQFRIKMFLFDAIAKASILKIKSVTGYSSCSKCTQTGEYIKDRVCFPTISYIKRTHNDFSMQHDPDHHTGHTILLDIPGINIVDNVPLDYMHLVCLGVVKKFLVSTWCYGPPPHKFSFAQIETISNKLQDFTKYIPTEFARRPRALKDCKRWKATEFRQFLLYTGPIVLKDILSKDKYEHFLTLHVSITILVSNKYHLKYNNYAKELLKHFVSITKIIYGSHFLIHNIHNLLHLSDDVLKFGPLDNFSNFSSENYLFFLKKLIRKHNNVLPQIIRRVAEINLHTLQTNNVDHTKFTLSMPHSNGILITNCTDPQYRVVQFRDFKLSTTLRDSLCLLKDSTVVEIENFAFCTILNEYVLLGRPYKQRIDFYDIPCKSSALDIYLVKEIGELCYWSLSEINMKLMKLPFKDQHVVFPLLHTN